MRVLVTGASGHIGSAVIPELHASGHTVVGLARSDEAAARVAALGAEVRRGDLADLDSIRAAAADADGVIHLAFDHAAMRSGDYFSAAATDLAVVGAIGDVLSGTAKPLVTTSGTLLVAIFAGVTGREGTEDDVAAAGPRADVENLTVALAGRGVRSSVVRLPPIVHSDLDHHGFAPMLIGFARASGFAGYIGDGANRWPAVDTRDAARAYRLALELAPAGARLHAVGDSGVAFASIAAAIGAKLKVPARSVAADDAATHFGVLAGFAGIDNPTSSAITRQVLGWSPSRPGLLEDLAADHYYAS